MMFEQLQTAATGQDIAERRVCFADLLLFSFLLTVFTFPIVLTFERAKS